MTDVWWPVDWFLPTHLSVFLAAVASYWLTWQWGSPTWRTNSTCRGFVLLFPHNTPRWQVPPHARGRLIKLKSKSDFFLIGLCKNMLIVKSIFTLIWVNRYGSHSFNPSKPSSASVQCVAARRVVSLSSDYFLQKAFHTIITPKRH